MGYILERRPIFGNSLPAVDWQKEGKRLRLDPAIDPLRNACIYRYASIPEALAICRGRWSFARPSTWSDKYEKHISKSLFGDGAPFAGVSAHVKCLSAEFSSEAMWRTYSSDCGLVRLGIQLPNLLDWLDHASWYARAKVYVGRVRYMASPRIRAEVVSLQKNGAKNTSARAMEALLMKRSGFSYENEIRVSFVSQVGDTTPDYHFAGDFSRNLVTRLLIDPYLQQWQVKELKMLFKDELKVPFKVEQSAFNKHPTEI